MNYWSKKEQLMKQAAEHTDRMARTYSANIQECINHSVIHRKKPDVPPICHNTSIIIEENYSVPSVIKHCDPEHTTCVLNFASYKEPGGRFMDGSSAQEESLCHSSYLYNVLWAFEDTFYAENCKCLNKALYTNAAIFSPDVMFFDNDAAYYANVLTCAAPNKTTAQKYCHVSDEENRRVLADRIDFVLGIMAHYFVDTIILGAYGCGVFGQNPEEVASIFKEYLNGKYNNVFRLVVFAIPDKDSANYKAFEQVFHS